MSYIYRAAVSLQGLLHDEALPSPEAFRRPAGRLKPCPFQQGHTPSAPHTHDILCNHVLCQVKFKGAERIRGNGNAVLSLLAVCQRHLRLHLQFFSLYFGNVLTGKQHLGRPAVLSLQADGAHMLPLRMAVILHMTLKAHLIPLLQCLHKVIGRNGFGKFLPRLLLSQNRTHMSHQLLVTAPGFDTALLRMGPCQILVGSRLEIYNGKPVKQDIDALNNIPHLPVFPLKTLFLTPRTDQQENDINGKQDNQADFQLNPHQILRPYHFLSNVLRKCLHQDKFIVIQICHTDVIRFAVSRTQEASFPAAGKHLAYFSRRSLIDDAFLRQYLCQAAFIGPAAVGTRDHPFLRRTQIYVGRLSEIGGGKHAPQIFLRQIGRAQHSHDFSLPVNRRVKTHHLLVKKMRVKKNTGSVFPLHSLLIEKESRRIGRPPVGSIIHPFGIRIHQCVKDHFLFHICQRLRRNHRSLHTFPHKKSICSNPVQRVPQFAVNLIRLQLRGIRRIIFVALFNALPVPRGVPLE